MSSADLRRRYVASRVLMDANRILESTGSYAVVVSGAQGEILRNVVEYATRRDSYVDSYYGTYYTMPDDTDWNAIDEIASDLEYRLMPSDNTIFGLSDTFRNIEQHGVVTGPNYSRTWGPVPSGYWYVLLNAWIGNFSRSSTYTFISVTSSDGTDHIKAAPSLLQYMPLVYDGRYVMKPGDYVTWTVNTVQPLDDMRMGCSGYVMTMPG